MQRVKRAMLSIERESFVQMMLLTDYTGLTLWGMSSFPTANTPGLAVFAEQGTVLAR